jgi:hypothetical protein
MWDGGNVDAVASGACVVEVGFSSDVAKVVVWSIVVVRSTVVILSLEWLLTGLLGALVVLLAVVAFKVVSTVGWEVEPVRLVDFRSVRDEFWDVPVILVSVVELWRDRPVVSLMVEVVFTTIGVKAVDFAGVGTLEVELDIIANGAVLVCGSVDVWLVSAWLWPDGNDVGPRDVLEGNEEDAAGDW